MKLNSIKRQIIFSTGYGLLLGGIVSAVSAGNFWLGWLGAGTLCTLLCFGMMKTWQFLKGGKTLAVLMIVSFLVRITLGTFLYVALPVLGYDTEVQNAGYVFSDAFKRDTAAYEMSQVHGSWWIELGLSKSADQYGGVLLVSAAVYRIFSMDAHRPLMMVLFMAFIMTIGLAFLFDGTKKRWGAKIALIAGWVFALYPEGILLGSSQMREPFLMGLAGIAFWVCLSWREKPVRTLLVTSLLIALACFISIPSGLLFLVVLAGMVFLEWQAAQKNKKTKLLGWCLFALGLLLTGAAGWWWLKNSYTYDLFMTEANSGWIAELIKQYGANARIPFITAYGLTQPLLPAAIVDPALPIWTGIGIFRASGWYFILSFILYGVFALLCSQKRESNSVLLWFMGVFLAWTIISSLRAGGDQWDNPRYRTLFLPWLSILIGWVWNRVQTGRHPWFWRWVAVESVCVLFFLNWYINRYIDLGTQIWFTDMMKIIAFICGAIFFFGFLWDIIKSPESDSSGDLSKKGNP